MGSFGGHTELPEETSSICFFGSREKVSPCQYTPCASVCFETTPVRDSLKTSNFVSFLSWFN